MRAMRHAAFVAAVMIAHVAAAETLTPAGLGGGADAGGVSGAIIQPGLLDADFRLGHLSASTSLKDLHAPRLRRVGSMLDLALPGDAGLRLSAGFRNFGRKLRGFDPFHAAKPTALIYTPATLGLVPVRAAIRRSAPTLAMGWSHAVAAHALFGLEAGTSFDSGNGRGIGLAARQLSGGWTRTNPVAQASFAWRF